MIFCPCYQPVPKFLIYQRSKVMIPNASKGPQSTRICSQPILTWSPYTHPNPPVWSFNGSGVPQRSESATQTACASPIGGLSNTRPFRSEKNCYWRGFHWSFFTQQKMGLYNNPAWHCSSLLGFWKTALKSPNKRPHSAAFAAVVSIQSVWRLECFFYLFLGGLYKWKCLWRFME